ncbi:hypothetical protein IMZ11_14675 [Microtetraspora sp. AC03309]|uniref:hypothetical protein n=1 Tax=Microtetraspora sp. AC03309 TaxID=2779376 RepID=UPI001E50FB0C|nr:hypothetical protein [Microtetraspora sp. AC03309]MCC5576874.1 hypothetical protein [Microtetraspora sp. AC03309]
MILPMSSGVHAYALGPAHRVDRDARRHRRVGLPRVLPVRTRDLVAVQAMHRRG